MKLVREALWSEEVIHGYDFKGTIGGNPNNFDAMISLQEVDNEPHSSCEL